MAKIDIEYHKLLQKIRNEGFRYEDPNRKNVFRYQIPSYTLVHNFDDGFPAITTKKLYWKGVVGELLWFLRGDTNIKYLVDNGINIWNKDAYNWLIKNYSISEGETPTIKEIFKNPDSWNLDLGRVYGAQWRNWFISDNNPGGLDQISNLIKGLKETPMGTKHIVTAWNPAELDDMALPPCHWSFEILVEPLNWFERTGLVKPSDHIKQKLNVKAIKNGKCSKELDMEYYNSLDTPKYQFTLKWHQRSVDTFLGLPFNIASYALLAKLIGKMTNMIPKGIIGDLSNVHIYEAHIDAVKEQLSRDVNKYNNCDLTISTKAQAELIDGLKYINNNNIEIKDLMLLDYESYPSIKAEMLAYNK